jgi:HPt (histidine-containing phosphotransfer) domain-containing protein
MDSTREQIKYDEVDFDSAIEDFGEETVQFCVASFLDKTYKELKANIPKLYKTQNYKEIRGKMHILKTNSGYMGAANFSALCKEFETSCKFESLNEEKIDELYPIFMTNLDKLYSRLKKLNKERFEAPQEPEPEPENQKEPEKKQEENKENSENIENKESNQNKDNKDNKENKEKQEEKKEVKESKEIKENNVIKQEDKNITNNNTTEVKENKENNIIIDNKETNENKEKIENKTDINENKVIQNENDSNKNKNEFIDNKKKLETNEIMEENDEEEINGGIIELKKCPKESKTDVGFKKLVSTSNKDLPINNSNINEEKNTNKINFIIPPQSVRMKKMDKIRNFSSSNLSSSNIHDFRNIKQGKIETFRGNPRYEKIVRSFEMAKEENKRKKENKISMSPKHTVETEKHKVLNRVKLGFSTMDKNEIRDCLKRYDIAVLKNSATLVNDNLNKFLNDVFPTIINDLNKYLIESDLSKKKEIIEKVNLIISNMKYLSDNYNVFLFRMNERLEICKDNEKFKLILNDLIQKLYMLEEELTIIDKVKIKKDDTFLKKMGYFQENTYTKTSKKNVAMDSSFLNNKINNHEQIEGLKKNLSVNNGKIKEQKMSRKRLKHFPSFKDQKLFMIEDKKQIYSSFKTAINHESNKLVQKNDKGLISKFEEELPKFNELFRESINNKNKEQLIQVISDFENSIVKKYGFSNLEPVMEKWVTRIKRGDSFDDLNANIEDIQEIFEYMKQEFGNKNLEVIGHEEESQNDENIFEEDKDDKNEDDPIEKEDMALYSQLRQFNAASFFQPKNQGLSQHKFKLKVEKIIRETTGNSNEIINNNQNSNYNLVEKISSHIVLSQNFRTKKNKLIGFSYPFKEDTFLNNCYIF